MGLRKSILTFCAVCALATLGGSSRAAVTPIALGWNYGAQTSTYITRDSDAPGLNTVSPAWWMLRSNGTIADDGNRAFVRWAHARGMRVWPMFTNGLDQVSSRHAMTDAALRAKVIGQIRDLAHRYGADGINVDWENLATTDKNSFTAFVQQATATWRATGLVTSVDISARTDHWQLGNWSESFDQRALGAAADYVVLMAYDEHNRLRPVGPTASLPWVDESIRYLLRTTPPNKVILGVPFYSNDWDTKTKKGTVVTYADTLAHARAHHATISWDARAGSNVARYPGHVMWYEGPRSLSMKAALVGRYGLAGIAAWRIGFETPDAWRAITAAPEPAIAPPSPVQTISSTPRATTPAPTARPTRVAAAPLPPVRRTAKRLSYPLAAAIVAFVVAAAVTFVGRRARRS